MSRKDARFQPTYEGLKLPVTTWGGNWNGSFPAYL